MGKVRGVLPLLLSSKGAIVVAAAALLVVPAVAKPSGAPPERGRYLTWAEAVAQGHPVVAEFVRPEGVPDCPPTALAQASTQQPPDPNGPVCYSRPEHQGLLIPAGSTSGDVETQREGSALELPSFDRKLIGESVDQLRYRFVGSRTLYYNFERALSTHEVSNPSIGHPVGGQGQHFYSRMSAISTAGNNIEIGWLESNYGSYWTGDYPVVVTVAHPAGQGQSPVLHTNWFLTLGAEHSFRMGQCGGAGQYDVCWEFWTGSAWAIIRQWLGTMRCELPNGDANCHFNWLSEANAGDGTSWFAINGGPDGLRTRNIQVRTAGNNWFMFDASLGFAGGWEQRHPYYLCAVSDWHHFRTYYGSPSC